MTREEYKRSKDFGTMTEIEIIKDIATSNASMAFDQRGDKARDYGCVRAYIQNTCDTLNEYGLNDELSIASGLHAFTGEYLRLTMSGK